MIEESRIVLLCGEVNEESATQVISELLYFSSINSEEDIYLYINSNGGSIIHGMAIYDTIKLIKPDVVTVCYGMAASMGAFLLSCGKKGKRYALPHSKIMIHQPLCQLGGLLTESRLAKTAKSITENRNELESIMAFNCGKDIERLHKDCERDNYLSAKEAKEYGLIDNVLYENIE